MKYYDEIYGEVTIEAPVLRDLMETAAMQRLRGVWQHGISDLIGLTRPVTRFQHSVGAMLLVRRLGGDLRRQIAALLHDVSHTAFSHVIDYVVDGHDDQSYHDREKETYLAGSDVPAALAAHGYHWRDFLHEEDFPLLEQPSPRLCADRLDYFLRDSIGLELATAADAARVLAQLVVVDGRIAVADVETARWLGDAFMAADDASWSNFHEVGIYEVTARAIKIGLEVGAISEADFWSTDAPLWATLRAHPDPRLQAQLALVTPETRFVWDEENPTFRISTKIRTIDPDVVVAEGGERGLRPLSTLDPAFARRRRAYVARKSGKWPMRLRGSTCPDPLIPIS